MIAALNLSKSFCDINAVCGMSFSIKEHEVVGLLGTNGAGKTTTMRMLTTFLAPSSGTALVNGFDILKQPMGVRKSIGYLPELPPLYPELRVSEYLTFIAKLRDVPRSKIRQNINSVIEQCGLSNVTNRVCSTLSRGYRQRVGLAQAIIHEPPVIILDEPTAGLDPAQIIEMRKLISNLREKHTVILSTHILQEVTQTCSSVIIVSNGKVVLSKPLTEFTSEHNLEENFLQAVSGTIN